MYRSNLISRTLANILSNIGFNRTAASVSCNVVHKNNIFVKSLRLCVLEKYHRYGNNRSQETKKFYLLPMFLPALIQRFFLDESDDETSQIVIAIKRSILLIQKREFDKAEQMLHIALHQAQIVQHYEAITYIYDVMANLAFETEDYPKAEKLFVTVLQRLMSKGVLENDMKVIHISLKMAKVMENLGQVKKADLGYKFCIKHLQSLIEIDPENNDAINLKVLTFTWYGQMLISQSRIIEAYNYLLQAYNILKNFKDDKDENVALLHNDLGAICYMQEKYDEAMEHFSAAAEIGRSIPDMNYFDVIHINIGNVFLRKGLYNEAKKSCQKGKKIAKERNNGDALEEADECLKEVKRLLSL